MSAGWPLLKGLQFAVRSFNGPVQAFAVFGLLALHLAGPDLRDRVVTDLIYGQERPTPGIVFLQLVICLLMVWYLVDIWRSRRRTAGALAKAEANDAQEVP